MYLAVYSTHSHFNRVTQHKIFYYKNKILFLLQYVVCMGQLPYLIMSDMNACRQLPEMASYQIRYNYLDCLNGHVL